MDKEVTIGALATSGAALGGWLFREFAKWLLERQKKRDEAEHEREKHERERADRDRADVIKAREEMRSILSKQIDELANRLERVQDLMMKVTEEKVALTHRVAILQDELEDLREACARCPVKKGL